VVAEEVEDAVHEELGDLPLERPATPLGLARRGRNRDHDVAEQRRIVLRLAFALREGEDIGRPVLAAPLAVQLAHRLVVDERDRERARRLAEEAQALACEAAHPRGVTGEAPDGADVY